MATTGTPAQRLLRIVRIAKARPRLLIAIAIGVAVAIGLASFTSWRLALSLILGWNICAGLYLALAFRLMAKADVHRIRRQARVQDEGQFAILILTAAAALASLAAIFALLSASAGAARHPAEFLLAVITILLSWTFTHTIFALHYAHEYYDENHGKGGGMIFPGNEPEPDYWDFMYFSFVIGMCAQVSDVTVSNRSIRRTVFGHSVVSFIFNAALVALTVNIAAGAI
jgi:uncharacterized membrane protein